MHVTRTGDPAEWLEQVGPQLEAAEAENGLVLGNAIRARDAGSDDMEMWTVSDVGTIIGAALRTPPRDLLVTRQPGAALAALADALSAAGADLPGVIGPGETASEFASQWRSIRSVDARLRMRQLLYECREVLPVESAPGRFRAAEGTDISVLAPMLALFCDDVGVARPTEDPAAIVGRQIEEQAVFVWEEDGVVVSSAAVARPTPHGIAVNFVYTPPEHRGRGYATSCVAALTQRMLKSGKRFCCLYTDAENPTSNAIYRRIGYRVVSQGEWVEFSARR